MKQLMIGNAAVARGAYEAGVRVVASYPGTPSTEITECIAGYPAEEVYAEWAPNEKVACEVAVGASIGGARAMTCCKHVGLNVMADPIFTASYTGVNGGLVVCVADDPGMHSSQNEQDSRHYAAASKIPMLEPADSEECLAYTRLAFALSEEYDTPVFIRLSTRVSHSQSLVETGTREEKDLRPYEKNVQKYVMMPAMARGRHVVVEDRCARLAAFAEVTELNRVTATDKTVNGRRIGVITNGITDLYAHEALGDSVSYCKLGMVYPLPTEKLRAFAASCDELYVIEELDPVIETHVRALGIPCHGKDVFSLIGEYTPAKIASVILGAAPAPSIAIDPIPVRPPVMCAGCPHRGTFYVLKKLGLTVSGDIGCYTLGAAAPLAAVDTTICMGASVSAALGMAKARGEDFAKKLVSVIGDSTFMHSGVTGLIDIVYNKGINTVIVLDNSITGMTGHQNNPLNGKTIRGEATKQVDLMALCHAVGIEHVTVADPFDTKAFEAAVKEACALDAPAVVIAQRPCALLKTVKYTGHCVSTDACKKCGLCMKLGCPAISRSKEGVIRIDPNQCNGCGLCVGVCPFHAIEKVED